MCFFDSPVGRCEAVKEMVLLDETQNECACEHGCPPGCACPLAGCFATVSDVSEEMADMLAAKAADAAVAKAAARKMGQAVAA
ncbi:MAG: hypothetical protein EYC67_08140 [Betaproteobacteria bacterium]|nr:MAG: hypothetical protein EYC67_08140 [Betaproteobacteria bacterium]